MPRATFDMPMPLLCRRKENLAVWQMGQWLFYNVDYIEPLPVSGQSVVDLGAVVTAGNSALTEITTFNVDYHQLLQLRWCPLDDIEGQLFLTRSQAKFATRSVQTRVSKAQQAFDPYYEQSEFNILGRDRNPFVTAFNNTGHNLAQTRFQFWGYKYIMIPMQRVEQWQDQTGILRTRIEGTQIPINFSFADAEGRLS